MTITTKYLKVFQSIVRGIAIFMMNINNIITITKSANSFNAKFFYKAQRYLSSFVMFHSIVKVFFINACSMFFIPLFLVSKSIEMFTFLRTCVGSTHGSKNLLARSTRFVFISHKLSYFIQD